MRTTLSIISLMFLLNELYAQTGTYSQVSILDSNLGVNGDHTYIFRADQISDRTRLLINMGDEWTSDFEIGYRFYSDGQWYKNFSLDGYGNGYFRGSVGVGIVSPSSMLHIRTPNYETSGLRVESDNATFKFDNHAIVLESKPNWSNVPHISWFAPNGARQAYLGWDPNVFNLTVENGYNFSINGGNVGIGTTTPDAKLTVAGKVHAQEIKVATTAGADFVFEENYNLRSLEETEMFIRDNKHLPDIPSAKEMVDDGISVGEMNVKLLQKIEELTLYVIELKKENVQLKNMFEGHYEEVKELKQHMVNSR